MDTSSPMPAAMQDALTNRRLSSLIAAHHLASAFVAGAPFPSVCPRPFSTTRTAGAADETPQLG